MDTIPNLSWTVLNRLLIKYVASTKKNLNTISDLRNHIHEILNEFLSTNIKDYHSEAGEPIPVTVIISPSTMLDEMLTTLQLPQAEYEQHTRADGCVVEACVFYPSTDALLSSVSEPSMVSHLKTIVMPIKVQHSGLLNTWPTTTISILLIITIRGGQKQVAYE